MNPVRTTRYFGNALFVGLLLCCTGLLAWLSTHGSLQWDLTTDRQHRLSAAGQTLLRQMSTPLTLIGFAGNEAMRQRMTRFIARYREHKPDLEFRFIDPWERPDEVNRYNVTTPGELVILYGGRQATLRPSVQARTQAPPFKEKQLNAVLQRLLRAQQQVIYFLTGHGERPADGTVNHGLAIWAGLLRNRGFDIATLAASRNTIPDDAALLVLASPQIDWLLLELLAVRDYIQRGGSLLWLSDPGPAYGLEPLATLLGVHFSGDPLLALKTQLSLNDRNFLLPDPTAYPDHPVLRDFQFQTLFPHSQAVLRDDDITTDWRYEPLLHAGTTKAPIALLLERVPDAGEVQRVAILGDGDFLSNTYIQNGGNAELGLRLVDWLTHNDALIAALEDSAAEAVLTFSDRGRALFALFFLAGIPLGLLLLAWRAHRRRAP